MEDPVLNRNLDEIKELQTRWNQFHDFINMAMQQGPSKITPQAEMKFLELKSRIAMLHDGFIGGSKQHDAKTAQNIIQIVADAILLKKSAGASPAERQKFEFDWNECFMLINDTISSLEEEKKRLAGINERAYRMAQRREMMRAKFHNFLHHPALKWSVGLIVFVFVLWGLPAFGIYHWDQLYLNPPFGMNFTKPFYRNLVGYAYRPFINKELEYCDLAEVSTNDAANKFGAVDKPSTIDPNRFKSTTMSEIGLTGNLAAARSLFDGRKDKSFIVQQMDLQGALTFISFVFETTDNAKKFVDLANEDLAKASNKEAVRNRVYMMRKANLIVLGIGTHALREGYVKEKWKPFDEANQLK